MNLGSRQTLSCPSAKKSCTMYAPSELAATSDFALCSAGKPEEISDFYRGSPAEKVPNSPAPSRRRMDFYKHPCPPAATPPTVECDGQLSLEEPRRFPATCDGAHLYADGWLDALFGYSRITLLGVVTRHIPFSLHGRSATWAALSPDEKLISVLHDEKLRSHRAEDGPRRGIVRFRPVPAPIGREDFLLAQPPDGVCSRHCLRSPARRGRAAIAAGVR